MPSSYTPLLLAALVVYTASLAQVRAETSPSPPDSILFLKLGHDGASKLSERIFVSELRIRLENLSIREAAPTARDFSQLTATRQVREVRPLLKRHGSLAAIWITRSPPGRLVLHLVVVSQGRALVRLVETEEMGEPEASLATAAQELISMSYIFDTPESKWSFVAEMRSHGGLVEAHGPWLWLGGGLGLERRIFAGLSVQLSIGAFGGPIGSSKDLDISGWALAPALSARYLWEVGPVEIGPALGFRT